MLLLGSNSEVVFDYVHHEDDETSSRDEWVRSGVPIEDSYISKALS